jgi:Na+-transporting NADH:ubiquinone oxidoreductase subunit NqrF
LALTKASNRVVGVTTGTTTTITVPEGTQVPFGVGDYVSLSASGQSYYDFSHKQVLSVDSTSSYDGYHQTRMVVNHNSSGVVTAFSSNDASISISNKVSARGVGSGTLYYQQVQVTGQA